MKKNLLWMLAAILFCGAMTTVFTACGDDDDDDNGNGSSSTTSNVYEVTLAALLPTCSAPYLQLQVQYTDAEGKSETIIVKEGDQSQNLAMDAMDIYRNLTSGYRTKPEYVKYLDDLIVRNIKLRVPAGKSFSFEGTVKTRTDYTAPTEKVYLVRPCVISTAKLVSGTSKDRSELAENGSLSVIASMGIEAERFEELISRWNGREVGAGGATMQ